jgi:hypothetical protein
VERSEFDPSFWLKFFEYTKIRIAFLKWLGRRRATGCSRLRASLNPVLIRPGNTDAKMPAPRESRRMKQTWVWKSKAKLRSPRSSDHAVRRKSFTCFTWNQEQKVTDKKRLKTKNLVRYNTPRSVVCGQRFHSNLFPVLKKAYR